MPQFCCRLIRMARSILQRKHSPAGIRSSISITKILSLGCITSMHCTDALQPTATDVALYGNVCPAELCKKCVTDQYAVWKLYSCGPTLYYTGVHVSYGKGHFSGGWCQDFFRMPLVSIATNCWHWGFSHQLAGSYDATFRQMTLLARDVI